MFRDFALAEFEDNIYLCKLKERKKTQKKMRRGIIYLAAAALLLSSCDTYTGTGAATGASFGSILGSAIGGIAGGPRGSDIGTIVGMAGGAAVGASIGAQADQAQAQRVHDHYKRIQQNRERGYNPYDHHNQSNQAYRQDDQNNGNDDAYNFSNRDSDQENDEAASGFDSTNSGDDRITFTPSDSTDNYTAAQPTTVVPDSKSHFEVIPTGVKYTPNIEIANPRFVDANKDGYLNRGEDAKVTFEIYNRGQQTLFNVIPSVIETSGNRHIRITPSIIVESLAPGQGIVYTAFVKADKKLADGNAKFALAVLQCKKSISKVTEFNVSTKK